MQGYIMLRADCCILRWRGQPIPVLCGYLEESLHRFGRSGSCRLMWVERPGKFPENEYSSDLVTKAKVTGTDELLRRACLTLPGMISFLWRMVRVAVFRPMGILFPSYWRALPTKKLEETGSSAGAVAP